MTFGEALEIACSELQGNVDYLKDIYGENEPNIQDECNRLLTARNVLLKQLDGMQAQEDVIDAD